MIIEVKIIENVLESKLNNIVLWEKQNTAHCDWVSLRVNDKMA